jgi:hypothetical protein
MGFDTVPMIAFLGTITKWLKAVEERQIDHAKFLVNQLDVAGRLLAIDPEFKRIYSSVDHKCEQKDPEDVLPCMYAFFAAVTDAGQPGRYRSGRNHLGSGQ